MVEDRITDGQRVAQLLASELSGREDGALARISVVDADPDATSDPGGTLAYRVAVEGRRVADVDIYPEGAVVSLDAESGALDVGAVVDAVDGPGLTAEAGDDDSGPGEGATLDDGTSFDDRPTPHDGATRLRIEYGAAVKRAVDALVAGVEP